MTRGVITFLPFPHTASNSEWLGSSSTSLEKNESQAWVHIFDDVQRAEGRFSLFVRELINRETKKNTRHFMSIKETKKTRENNTAKHIVFSLLSPHIIQFRMA